MTFFLDRSHPTTDTLASIADAQASRIAELEAMTERMDLYIREWRARGERITVLENDNARLREAAEDAERFRALMRCGRIKMQGSAGVNY